MKSLGVLDMKLAIHDAKRAYILTEQGDVIAPGKCVMRWGSTPEDENVLISGASGQLLPPHALAARAFSNIAARLDAQEVPLLKLRG